MENQGRLVSLDALRGMDMAIILGIDALIRGIASASGKLEGLATQMTHAEWEGLTVCDIIFPLFVFISGIAMSFSMRKQEAYGRKKWKTLVKIWWRAIILVMIGWAVNGWLTLTFDTMRYASVLGLIGISGALAGTWNLLLNNRWLGAVVTATVILLGVGIAQWQCGDYTPAGSVNAMIDQLYCPGCLVGRYYDPEGILCIVSATAMSLLGFATGCLLMRTDMTSLKKLIIMVIIGIIMLIVGMQMPVIKRIWTVGFVLSAGGISVLLMAGMHLIVDVMGRQTWTKPFLIIGSNSLLIYSLYNVFNLPQVANRLTCGLWKLTLSEPWHQAALAGSSFLLAWFICLFFYRRRVFVKL